MKILIPYSLLLLFFLIVRSSPALASMSADHAPVVNIESGASTATAHLSEFILAEPASMIDREEEDDAENNRRRIARRTMQFPCHRRPATCATVNPCVGHLCQAIPIRAVHPLLWQGSLRI